MISICVQLPRVPLWARAASKPLYNTFLVFENATRISFNKSVKSEFAILTHLPTLFLNTVRGNFRPKSFIITFFYYYFTPFSPNTNLCDII